MRFLARLFFLALIVFVIVGFLRGWFTLSGSNSTSDDGKIDMNLTIDKEKMNDDAEKAKDKANEIADDVGDKIK